MKTDEEIDQVMDEAEGEIEAVLTKYGLGIGLLYPDGISIMLTHEQKHPNGDYSIREREAF